MSKTSLFHHFFVDNFFVLLFAFFSMDLKAAKNFAFFYAHLELWQKTLSPTCTFSIFEDNRGRLGSKKQKNCLKMCLRI
jgi:hypothetical protein